MWQLLCTARLLQALLLVTLVANLAAGGTFEVALPALAHDRFGAGGYGALLACIAAGALLGALLSPRASNFGRPAVAGMAAFLALAAAVSLTPFLWGLPGAAAAIFVVGLTMGFANAVLITLIQQWAPRELLGRVMSLLLLGSLGSFPLSVAVAGFLIRHFGPSPFFPIVGVTLAVAVLGALTQRNVREMGAAEPSGMAPGTSAV